MQVHQQQVGHIEKEKNDKPSEITLDSATTKSLFCNKDLVMNRRKGKFMMEISTTTGMGVMKEEADVPEFREILFSKDAIANLFALDEPCQKYHVTFDNYKENTFIVELNRIEQMNLRGTTKDCILIFLLGHKIVKKCQKGSRNSACWWGADKKCSEEDARQRLYI